MSEELHHATIVLEHKYAAPIERVYSQFADPQVRSQWSAPGNSGLAYDHSDFREGGRDVFRCGPGNDLRFQGETVYHVIIPDRCVISSEILTEGGSRLAVALNTLEFEPAAEGCHIKLTVQVVSFVGAGMVSGYESGNRGALEGLARHLAENP